MNKNRGSLEPLTDHMALKAKRPRRLGALAGRRAGAAALVFLMLLMSVQFTGGAAAQSAEVAQQAAVRGHATQEAQAQAQPSTHQYTLSSRYYIYFQVYAHGAGVSIKFTVSASSAVDVMVMDESQFSAFRSSGSVSAIYRDATSSVNTSVSLPSSGTYYLLVYNDISQSTVSVTVGYSTTPVDIYQLYSRVPVPTGVADYGVQNASGTLIPYSQTVTGVTGTAVLNSITAFNGSAPRGASPYGASLQVNVMLQVNTTSRQYVYWLQNVLSLYTNNDTAYFVDNIWNYSAHGAVLNPSMIHGAGNVYPSDGRNYYAASTLIFSYALPLSVKMPISVSSSGNSATVTFSYQQSSNAPLSGGGVYDKATITEPQNIVAAAIVVSGYTLNPGGTFYDAELVFGGQCCSAITTFTGMDSTLSLSYTQPSGDVASPRSLYGFGSDTAEAAFNLQTAQVQNKFHVGLGRADLSKNFVLGPLVQFRLTLSYAVAGGSTLATPPVLDYFSNGTDLSAPLGTTPTTFKVDAGSRWTVTNTLPGSAGERWATHDTSNGTASSDVTAVLQYHHQFLATAAFSTVGPGQPQPPSLRGTSFGVQIGSVLGRVNASYWLDGGSRWSVPGQLNGSSAAQRWEAEGATSGTVIARFSIRPVYFNQYLVTVNFEIVGGGTAGNVVVNSTSLGVSGQTSVSSSGAIIWADAGTDISLGAVTSGSTATERWASNSTLTLVVTSPFTATPKYYHQYYVGIQPSSPGAATVSPKSGWFDEGSRVGLSSNAAAGWKFVAWTGSGLGSYSGNEATSTVVVQGPVTETAELYPGLELQAWPGGAIAYLFGATTGTVSPGSSEVVYAPPGTRVVLTAQPSILQTLVGWSGAASGSAGSVVVELQSPTQVAATFGLDYGRIAAIAGGTLVAVGLASVMLRRQRHGRVGLPPPPPPGASTFSGMYPAS